jgi:hypothetical protein
MSRNIEFEVDDETHARLERAAARLKRTVPEYVKWKPELDEPWMSSEEWLARNRVRGIRSNITREQVQAAINDLRGAWPGEESDRANP